LFYEKIAHGKGFPDADGVQVGSRSVRAKKPGSTARRSRRTPPNKAMSYDRMKTRETELRAEFDGWLEAAEAADAQEDKLHARRRGDEMPGWIADKQKRWPKSARPDKRLRRKPAAAVTAVAPCA